MTAESLANALKGRRVGANWMACCPAHEDRNPSLSIRDASGKVLLHCHAGCNQRDVLDALKSRGLWESGKSKRWAKQFHEVAKYSYTNENAELLYQIVRKECIDPLTGERLKQFLPRYSDGKGGWIWKKHPRQVLYHLPEVLEAPIVFVCEGEKDCETLRDWGFVATTNAGGAEAPWLESYTEALRGHEVILLPDADPPGRRRVLRIARALIGAAAKIIILDLGDGKDISEWFARGHSEVELIAHVEGQAVNQ